MAQSSGNLEDFVRLNRELPRAVCDKAIGGRPPHLGITVGEAKRSRVYSMEQSLKESQIVRFLLEDPAVSIWAPGLEADAKAAEGDRSLGALKERISLEVCTSMVTSGHVENLFTEHKGWFIDAHPRAGWDPRLEQDGILFLDSDGRVGRHRGQWKLAGWIEPYEVLTIRKGPRVYRRLSNPITNQTLLVMVETLERVPLGIFYAAGVASEWSWEVWKKSSEAAVLRKKKVDAYRTLIESDAYEALLVRKDRVEAIRKLQEFYKSLIHAYEMVPEDSRFSNGQTSEAIKKWNPEKVLDPSFLSEMRGTQLTTGQVGFTYLSPDVRLHGIFEEFRKKLKEVLK